MLGFGIFILLRAVWNATSLSNALILAFEDPVAVNFLFISLRSGRTKILDLQWYLYRFFRMILSEYIDKFEVTVYPFERFLHELAKDASNKPFH